MGFGNLKFFQQFCIINNAIDNGKAHLVKFFCRIFQVIFNLLQAELVISSFIPIRLSIHGVKMKAIFCSKALPIAALRAGNTLHGSAA